MRRWPIIHNSLYGDIVTIRWGRKTAMVVLLWVALFAGILLVVYGFIVGGSPLGISPSVAIGGVLAFLSNYYLQRESARSQRETEEVRENAQAQDAAMAAYTEKMSDLVIEQNVDERSDNPHIHRVAQALTTSILVQLDAFHRRIVLQVVYTLGLISQIELVGATLDHADLTELDLRDARLRFANLRGA